MSLSKLTANLAILLDSTVDNVDSYLNGTTAGDAVDSVVEGGAAAEPTLLTTLVSFLPFILIIVCFYFFLIRPQRKQVLFVRLKMKIPILLKPVLIKIEFP